MNRRDFLRFRTGRRGRVVELSCRRLHLRHLEWLSTSEPFDGGSSGMNDGEPDASFHSEPIADLLDALAATLQPEDTLLVVDRQWLQDPALVERVELLTRTHRARNGQVDA